MSALYAQILKTLIHHVGLLALLILVYSELLKWFAKSAQLRELFIGLVLGIGGVITMFDPIMIAPGVLVDGRNVVIGLAGLFGGPLALAVCAAMSGGFIMAIGGVGAYPSLIGLSIAALFSMAFARYCGRNSVTITVDRLFLLGMGTSLCYLSVTLLPDYLWRTYLANAMLPLVATTTAGIMLLGIVLNRQVKLLHAEQRIKDFALTDPLTGLANRRAFQLVMQKSFAQAKRNGGRVDLLLLDIDHFKHINDTYGHDAGDAVLTALGAYLKGTLREGDLAARYGGEEFVILLEPGDKAAAVQLAERLVEQIRVLVVETAAGKIGFTASIGVGRQNRSTERPEQIITAADKALYLAKEQGRDRVCAIEFLAPKSADQTAVAAA
jgi:diguanylate cyclase